MICIKVLLAQNSPPVAVDDSIMVFTFAPTEINVMHNDYWKEGHDSKILAVFSKFFNISFTDSTIIYNPLENFHGGDTLLYFIIDIDNSMISDMAKVFVFVNNPIFDSLNINNVSARFNAYGNHFFYMYNYSHTFRHFRVPATGSKSIFWNNSLWIRGLDAENKLHISAELLRFSESHDKDFSEGPASENKDTAYYLKWNRVWKINKAEIDYHRDHYWEEDYIPAEIILSWPGNGDPEYGHPERIAPFYDVNEDGIYQPMEGDYPVIRGTQAIFFIFNDQNTEHTVTNSRKLGINVYGMAYAFDCPNDPALFNSVFLHYDIRNLSDTVYFDTSIGIYTNPNFCGRYFGCDVNRSSYYWYDNDQLSREKAEDTPPSQAVTILAGPFLDPDGLDNPSVASTGIPFCDYSINGKNFGDSIVDNERMGLTGLMVIRSGPNSIMGWPQNESDFNQYIQCHWKDGISLKYGNGGHPDLGSTETNCRFIFPWDSDSLNWGSGCEYPAGGFNQNGYYWYHAYYGFMIPRMEGLGITGPFTFFPGDIIPLDIAFISGYDKEISGGEAGRQIMLQRIDKIREYFKNDQTPCNNGSFSEIPTIKKDLWKFNIFPVPAQNFIRIEIDQDITSSYYYIYNATGKLVKQGQLSGEHPYYIDINNFPNGLYFIYLKNDCFFSGKLFIKSGK
jgi:hypothetical protein